MDKHTKTICWVALTALATYIILPSFYPTPLLARYTTGLVNIGNDCYANSIFQALSSLETLYQWLQSHDSSQWTSAMIEMLGTIKNESHQHRYSTSIRPMLKLLEMLYRQRFSYAQQDAHELFIRVVEAIEGEDDSKTPFSAVETDTIQCRKCGHTVTNSHSIVSLQIQPEGPLFETEWEHIPDYRCEYCNTQGWVQKRTEMTEYPEILVVHINRSSFQQGQLFRNQIETDIPLRVGIYELRAVIFHKGSHNRGHYTCARRKLHVGVKGEEQLNPGQVKNWWLISDESVKEVTQRQVADRKKDAYMMFFERNKLR